MLFFELVDLVPVEVLEEILLRFSKVTKLTTLITDRQGHPITSQRDFNHVCKLVRKFPEPELEQLCIRSDASAGIEAANRKKPFIYRCHAGLVDAVVPIIIADRYWGAIFVGQTQLIEEDMCKIPELRVNGDITLNHYPGLEEQIKQYVSEQPRITLAQMEANVALLYTISNYIAEIGYKNLMQEELNQQKMKLIQEENSCISFQKNIARLELQLLQNQMNPRFLFNTLNAIYLQATLENSTKSANLLYSLINIIRRSAKQQSSHVTVEDEITYIQNYIQLKNVSTFQQTMIQINADRKSLDCFIPIFTLQPLVENVFVQYFIEKSLNNPILDISIKKVKDQVEIVLSCKQLLLSENERLALTGHSNNKKDSLIVTALNFRNVTEILTQYYQETFSWKVESSAGPGTYIEFSLPYSTDGFFPKPVKSNYA